MKRLVLLAMLVAGAGFAQNPVIQGYMRALELARQAREIKALEAQEQALRVQTEIMRQQQAAQAMARAPEAPRKPATTLVSLRLKIEVESLDTAFGEQIESSVASALRAIGDVQTVQEDPLATLRLNVLKLEVPPESPPMYLMSYSASHGWTSDVLNDALSDVRPEEMRDAIKQALSMAEIYSFHGATPINALYLDAVSKRIAAAVDSRLLKFLRGK